jgi:hypothetical protein
MGWRCARVHQPEPLGLHAQKTPHPPTERAGRADRGGEAGGEQPPRLRWPPFPPRGRLSAWRAWCGCPTRRRAHPGGAGGAAVSPHRRCVAALRRAAAALEMPGRRRFPRLRPRSAQALWEVARRAQRPLPLFARGRCARGQMAPEGQEPAVRADAAAGRREVVRITARPRSRCAPTRSLSCVPSSRRAAPSPARTCRASRTAAR